MSYSLDLRQRVVSYLQQGGHVTQAVKLYQVSRATIYRWLVRDNLAPTVVIRRPRKLDWNALEADVKAHPNDRLVDRAKRFGVGISTVAYALSRLKITHKKTTPLPRAQPSRPHHVLKNLERLGKTVRESQSGVCG